MTEGNEEKRWVLCPQCGAKTRLQIFRETELKTDSIYYLIIEKNIDVYSYAPIFTNEKKY